MATAPAAAERAAAAAAAGRVRVRDGEEGAALRRVGRGAARPARPLPQAPRPPAHTLAHDSQRPRLGSRPPRSGRLAPAPPAPSGGGITARPGRLERERGAARCVG